MVFYKWWSVFTAYIHFVRSLRILLSKVKMKEGSDKWLRKLSRK